MVTNSFEIQQEQNLPNKITSIKNIANSYNLIMRGYAIDPSINSWKIKGSALMGDKYITLTTNILYSFCEYANLITIKSEEKFFREFADSFYKVNAMLLNDRTRKKETQKTVIKIFKDRLSNIGDIIVGGRDLMQKIFENEDLLKEDVQEI